MPFLQSLLLTLWIAFGIYTMLIVLWTKGEPTKDTTRVGKIVYWHGFAFIAILIIHAAWFLLQLVARNIRADLMEM